MPAGSPRRRLRGAVIVVSTAGLLCLAACLALAPGPERMALADGAVELDGTLTWDGRERPFRIHLPPGYTRERAFPLVLALHGGGGEGRRLNAGLTDGTLDRAADDLGVIVCYPEGLDRLWLDPRPGSDAPHAKDPTYHAGYFRALLDHLGRLLAIDPDRVYATGMSNGGMMSLVLGLELSDRIAAIAPVTACLPERLARRRPARPLSVLLVNGTADPLVPYDGGEVRVLGRARGRVLSTAATLAIFREAAGCGEPATALLPDLDPDDGTRIRQTTWSGRDGVSVRLLEVRDGGHTWPGGRQYLGERLVGRTSRDLDASRAILTFFLRHARGAQPEMR